VILPKVSKHVDFECELCAVIGTSARKVTEAQALEEVFGYTILWDFSQRDPWGKGMHNTRNIKKGFDTFTGLGPWIVTRDEIPEPQDLVIRVQQNGKDVMTARGSETNATVNVPDANVNPTLDFWIRAAHFRCRARRRVEDRPHARRLSGRRGGAGEEHMFKINAMDHIVLNVPDIDRSLAFYMDVLGLEPERLDEFRRGEVRFPSVRISPGTVIDLFPMKPGETLGNGPGLPNLNHFTMVVEPAEFEGLQEHLAEHGVTIEEGPAPRWGARGRGQSVYFRDPDGNRIEVRCYP
jgi:catechol 2,3-dioxygenase-like lactoylglutathione lyase family enzyme